MGKFIKSEYRYPLFFIGVMTIVLSAFAMRYVHLSPRAAEALACVGFIILVVSVAAP